MPRARGLTALALAVALVVLAAPGCGSAVGDRATADTTKPTGSTPAPVDRGPVLFLGDSLTDGAERFGDLTDRLEDAGFTAIDVVAEIGRDVDWGRAQVEDMATVADLVIVELGTNPSAEADGFAEDAVELVDALRARGARHIAWLTPVHGRDDRYEEKTTALRGIPGIVVADWATRVKDDPRRLAADGLHPTEEGYVELAWFLVGTAIELDVG